MWSWGVSEAITGFTVCPWKSGPDTIGVGPGLGAILSTGLYTMMKVLDYDKVNGTQDRDDTS